MDIKLALETVSNAIGALMEWDLDMSDEDRQRYEMAEEVLCSFVREHNDNEIKKAFTLDEAIEHCCEVAEQQCNDCGKEHLQLAKWLVELKENRGLINRLKAENEEQERAIINALRRIKEARRTAKIEAYKECIEKVKEISTKKTFIYIADASIQEQEIGWLEIREDDLDNLSKELAGE